jgi:hypothetical protein
MFLEPGGLLSSASSQLRYAFWWSMEGPLDRRPARLEDDEGTWHDHGLSATERLALALPDELFPAAADDSAPWIA